MKHLLVTCMVITVLLGICAVDAFLALHDIKADYVSTSALEDGGVVHQPVPDDRQQVLGPAPAEPVVLSQVRRRG